MLCSSWKRWFVHGFCLVCLSFVFFLGQERSVRAHNPNCFVKGHTPLRSWKNLSVQILKKDLYKPVFIRVFGEKDQLYPVYKHRARSQTPHLTQKRIQMAKQAFADAFNMFRMHIFRAPRILGVHTAQKSLEVYAAGHQDVRLSDAYGWLSARCLECGTNQFAEFASLYLDPTVFSNIQSEPYNLIITVGHELMHAIQFDSHHARPCSTNEMPSWWAESTADALGVHLLKTLSSKTVRALGPHLRTIPREEDLGIRNYHRYPLDYNEDSKGNLGLVPYRTSSFWLHLARYYFPKHKTPYFFLKEMLADRAIRTLDRKRWDYWLTLTSKHILKRVKRPLNHVFATFATHAAATKVRLRRDPVQSLWVNLKQPRKTLKFPKWIKTVYNRSDWSSKWFGGCVRVRLRASALKRSAQSISIRLKEFTAKCIRLSVQGLQPGSSLSSIKVLAQAKRVRWVRQLHLGLAYSTSKTRFICNRKRRRGPSRLSHCLLPPIASKGRKRTWMVPPHQLRKKQTSFRSVYVLTRAPLPVSSCSQGSKHVCIAKIPSPLARKRRQIRLTFSLKVAQPVRSVQKKVKPPKGTSKRLRSTVDWVTLNSMLGQDIASIPLSGPIQGWDPLRPVQHLFTGNVYNRMIAQRMQQLKKRGLHSLTWKKLQIQRMSPELGDIRWKTLERFVIGFKKERPVFGKTGRFEVVVQGRSLNNASIRFVTSPKHKLFLTVFEFSTRSFRARLTGTLCKLSLYTLQKEDIRCLKLRDVQMDIVQPFPEFYTASQLFVTADTLGMKLFQKYELPGMLSRAQALQKASSSHSSSSVSQKDKHQTQTKSGSGSQSCVCTCQEKLRFEQAQAQVRSGKGSTAAMKVITEGLRCMYTCQAAYTKCKGGCDCSCTYRSKMLKLQNEHIRQGKKLTPQMHSFLRCALTCAVAHARCIQP